MRIPVTFRALRAWPNNLPQTAHRKRSAFNTRWSDTLSELDTELSQLGARDVVIELDCPEQDIRRDGVPKADARVRTPGVVLQFTRRRWVNQEEVTEAFLYPADTFYDWQDNVLAIARTLKMLRAIDRYGVTKSGQQYAGFKQLPASTGTPSVDEAAKIISAASGMLAADIRDTIAAAILAVRVARSRAHPDRQNGGHDLFVKVNRAAEVLAKHHAVTSW